MPSWRSGVAYMVAGLLKQNGNRRNGQIAIAACNFFVIMCHGLRATGVNGPSAKKQQCR